MKSEDSDWRNLVNWMNSPFDFSFYKNIENIGKFYVTRFKSRSSLCNDANIAKIRFPFSYHVRKATHFERCYLKYCKNWLNISHILKGEGMFEEVRAWIARKIYPKVFEFEKAIVEDNKFLIKENSLYFNNLLKVRKWWTSLSQATREKQNGIFDEINDMLESKHGGK